MLDSWQLGGQDLAGGLQFAYPCLACGRAEVRIQLGKPVDFQTRSTPGAVQDRSIPFVGSVQSVSKVYSSWEACAPCSGGGRRVGLELWIRQLRAGSLLSHSSKRRPEISPGPSLPICKVGLSREPRRRQWHPTPVLLPGKSHGRRSLVGCSPWGR